jgi:hypothetical protein
MQTFKFDVKCMTVNADLNLTRIPSWRPPSA